MPVDGEALVVTGIGLVTPLGTGADTVWGALLRGESGLHHPEELGADTDRGPGPSPRAGRAGYVRGFRPREHIAAQHLRRMDWCSRMAVAAAHQALGDAGLAPLDGQRRADTAIVIGSCYGNQRETEQFLSRVQLSGGSAAQPFIFPNLVLNAPAAYAAIELGIEGPNLTVSEHEASGEAALATAVDLIGSGGAARVCAGGVDEFGTVYVDALRDRRLLHPDSLAGDQRERARASRRGTRGAIVPGEGAAMLIVERAGDAARRGSRVYAEVEYAGVAGVAAPAYAYPVDVDRAAARLLAMIGEGDTSAQIDAVIGAADGTVIRHALDLAVLRAIEARQGDRVPYLPFKRLVGEWGAGGALGVAIAALAIGNRALPPIDTSGSPSDRASAAGGATRSGEGRDGARQSAPSRILVVGAARGGVLAPVVLRRAPSA